MKRLAYRISLIALAFAAASATAQTTRSAPSGPTNSSATAKLQGPEEPTKGAIELNEIVVTATRHNERLQDVPLSITVLSQAEMTQEGIVGFEGIARETPGVVLDQRSDNNLSITTR